MMGTKTQQMLQMLDDITALLDSYGESHRAGWIGGDASLLRSGGLTASLDSAPRDLSRPVPEF